jgi:hypothetical protein
VDINLACDSGGAAAVTPVSVSSASCVITIMATR